MMKANLQLLQEFTILFLVIIYGFELKVECFLQPNSVPDETYLGLIHEATDFSPAQEYDYIVVGGGTAGCPLATTLSENYSVLLLERGDVPGSDPNILYENRSINPLLTANLHDSPAQNFFSEDGVFNTRGRVLGGSSMVNFGFYSRADDYFYENSGIEWDMKGVKSAYEWVEDRIVTRTERLRKWQGSTFNALVEAGVSPDNGFVLDHVQGTKIGGSTFDDSGRRHGAVELLNKANPSNLKVVVHAIVDRVIFSTTSKSVAAIGVTYHDSKGRQHEVHVRTNGEVILSSGAIGSPQLLLLSGIGPIASLSSLKIPVVRDHPFVGQFMADNPRNGINLLVPDRLADVGVRVAGITESGPYIESTAVPRIASIIPFIPYLNSLPPINLSVVVLGGKVSRPKSSGSLNLVSADVSVSPKVRFNYFSQPEDVIQCGNVVKVLRKMLETQAMEEYKFPGIFGTASYFSYIGPSLPEDDDHESIESFCRKTLSTFWHVHGGCLVNKVVDGKLKVIGVDALRVIDASTFFNSPGTNPQATILMLGRYMGMKILNDRA